MEKQTVFVKRYIDKGEFPKDGWVLTPRGAWMFHGGRFRCPHDGTIQQGINEWLEEIELPTEEEIDINLFEYLFEQDSRANYALYQEGYKDGINFILNKLKKKGRK